MTAFGFFSQESQYAEHLAPVWSALDPSERSGWWATRRMSSIDVEPAGTNSDPQFWVTSSLSSAKKVQQLSEARIVYFEHGVGVAGPNGFKVDAEAFFSPNRFIADGYRSKSRARVEVVGTPKMDLLASIPAPDNGDVPVVALSIHWTAGRTELRSWMLALKALKETDLDVIAHAHPRIRIPESYLEKQSIEVVRSFADVVARADIYASDYGSTPYEWAALDRPGITLERTSARPSELRDQFPVGLRSSYTGIIKTSLEALKDSSEMREQRARIRSELYPYWGRSARRAVKLLRDLTPAPYVPSYRPWADISRPEKRGS